MSSSKVLKKKKGGLQLLLDNMLVAIRIDENNRKQIKLPYILN